MTKTSATCHRCGAALSASEARGLCPACLLETSLGGDDYHDSDGVGIDAPWLEQHGVTAPKLATPGARRFGDYELFEEIGRGGMGVIYRAVQVSLQRTVAVKTILTGPLTGRDFVRRFQTEVHAVAMLDHPNIVPIYEVGDHEGQPYYSMPLIAGRNLAEAIKQDGPVPARQAATLIATVARAIHYAHQRGVLHRDLKPANILLDASGEPHVTDFGLAKLIEQDDGLTLTQAVLGTPNYMAPEQAAGKARDLTTAADTYSLGALLFELLTGQRLFAAPTPLATMNRARDQEPPRPSSICPAVARDLEVICLKCLEKDPARRYASAGELADELDRFLKGEPIWARPVGPVGRTWRWCRRKPVLAGMVGAVAILLLTVTMVSTIAAIRIGAEVRRAEQNARELRLNLYVADMNVAYQAIEHNNFGLARQLIRKYLPHARRVQAGTEHQAGVEPEEDLRGWEWRYLWRQCQGDSLLTLSGHSRPVSCAMFSPDGKTLITASFDRTVRIWDAATKQTLRCLTEFVSPLQRNSVALSPDGKWLAVADGTDIHVFETTNWNKVRALPNQALDGFIFSLPIAFSSDGRTLSCNADTEIRHWDTASWEPRKSQPINLVGEFGRLLAYSSDGRHFATAQDNAIVIWNTSSNPPAHRVLGRLRWPTCVTFSPDGRLVAAVGQDDQAIVWDVEAGREVLRLALGQSLPLAVAFSPDGRRLATGEGESIKMWDSEQGRLVATLKGSQGGIWAVTFSPDGRTLVSASSDGTARLWSGLPSRTPSTVLTSGAPLSFSSDGRILTLFSTNSSVEYWDVGSGNMISNFKIPVSFGLRDKVAVSPNGELVAHVSTAGMARIWERATGQTIAELALDPPPKWAWVEFSPDARLVAISCQTRSRGGGGWSLVWDFQRGERRNLPGADVYQPSFSKDGRILATGFGTNVQLWSVPELKPGHRLAGHTNTINGVAFSSDGALLASIGRDSDIRLWDLATGRLKLLFAENQSGNGLRHAAFSPGGRTLASGAGVSLALWNVTVGRVVLPLAGKQRYLGPPMFSPDGNILVIGGGQSLPTMEPVELLQAPSMSEIEAAEMAAEPAQ